MSNNSNAANLEKALSIQEEWQLLAAGRRMPSSRSASESVSERNKKEQLEQLKAQAAKKKEKQKKRSKKPGRTSTSLTATSNLGAQVPQQINPSREQRSSRYH
jgi:hypothetical protein